LIMLTRLTHKDALNMMPVHVQSASVHHACTTAHGGTDHVDSLHRSTSMKLELDSVDEFTSGFHGRTQHGRAVIGRGAATPPTANQVETRTIADETDDGTSIPFPSTLGSPRHGARAHSYPGPSLVPLLDGACQIYRSTCPRKRPRPAVTGRGVPGPCGPPHTPLARSAP
jgi:hypothetical protein